MSNYETFSDWVLRARNNVPRSGPWPYVYEDADGDRVEIHFSDVDVIAERIDLTLTLYRDRESKQVMGAAIEGITSLLDQLHRKLPGFAFNVRKSTIDLRVLLIATQLLTSYEAASRHYLALIDRLAQQDSPTRLRLAHLAPTSAETAGE